MKKGFIGGSFDPITVGHVDMIKRAAALCDELNVAVLVNKDKSCMYTMDQRTEMVKAALAGIGNVSVTEFEGHMPTYVINNHFDVVFRGLRNGTDFDYELVLAQLYAKFYQGKCETVYLMTDPSLSYISSSIVRQNYPFGADVSDWVSPAVLELMNKFSGK